MKSPFADLPTLPVSIGKPIIWVFFALFFIGYAIITGILIYHWRKYGMSNKYIILAESLFLIVSVILLVLAFISLSLF